MKKLWKIILCAILALATVFALSSCNDANKIQKNISKKSDNFDTYRKVTVINLRSDKILLEVEGYLSIKDSTDKELAIIIQTGKNEYKMHYVYVGSEIVYLVEQLENTTTDPYHWYIRIHAVLPEIIYERRNEKINSNNAYAERVWRLPFSFVYVSAPVLVQRKNK